MKNCSLIELCIEKAIYRVLNPKCRMTYSNYISYFVRRYDLSIADDEEIRKQVKDYIDKNAAALFPNDYTINGKK